MLALLLARKGVSVILLEAQNDFRREFRGDTLHPSTLETMNEIGLADSLLKSPHAKIYKLNYILRGRRYEISDFSLLNTKYPYIAMLPQAHFIEFVVSEAKRYPNFQLLLGANVTDLIQENGSVRGVHYKTLDDRRSARALLTVGADGRSSRVRRLANLELVKTAPSIDVLWFHLPRKVSDPEEALVYFGHQNFMVFLGGHDYWQVGNVIRRNAYRQLRSAGLNTLRQNIAAVAPEFADRAAYLSDWKQVSALSVQPARLTRWYRPGLLLIGDAAHVMSPVGGVGINYAIQDAVVAANVLASSLKSGHLTTAKLRAVRRRREWPTRIIQLLQRVDQREIIDRALDSRREQTLQRLLRLAVRLPMLRYLVARLMAIGIWRVHVAN